MEYRNRKNKKKYKVLNEAVMNCTNSANMQRMVLYQDHKGTLFVRDYDEFNSKFIKISK